MSNRRVGGTAAVLCAASAAVILGLWTNHPGVVSAVDAPTAGGQPGAPVSPGVLQALTWRFIGPSSGNRVSAVVGDPQNPLVFYYGGNGGGVFKSVDAGLYWEPVSDGFFETGPVRAPA